VFWTALLALPVPLLVGFVALALAQADAPSTWLRDINRGMPGAVLVLSAAFAMAACCRPGGLGAAHFGWRSESLSWLRRASHWFAIVYVPLVLLAYCTLSSESGRYFHNLGRASFLFANAWLLVVLVRLFFLPRGIHTRLVRENRNRPVARSPYLWFIVVIVGPIGLMVLAALGYTMTAFDLSITLVLTLILIVGGAIFCSLALRWFKIKHRKLALAEALERRRARQEAAASEGQEEESGEIVSVDDVGEQELDLDSVGEQTRHLLRLLFGLGVAAAVLSLWSTTLPLIPYLDTIAIPMTVDFSLLELAKAVLIAGVTWLVTRNLPGMLELAVLRATSMDTGTRHAITTICQYAVVTTGFVFLFNVLNLDWAKFGWIAGGLSVGIGFGLQEVVANFVCGLILLFERPIRVGDVVTVEGTTGTVTRIHMRATTITNWDRQEFVVPNKTLITNTLLNWTLSAALNRIVIPVGVAYGSDTEQARQIMLDVAADHPRILEDPAPQAVFEQFADSSLNLALRAFVPNLDNRIGTITELHTEIDKRFAAAGIEIAFPQRDVHIRNSTESTLTDASESSTDGEASRIRGSERSTAK
jgi:potassium efflux system protein